MRIVFDQGTPAPLRRALPGHAVATAFELGWSDLANGDLLRQAETRFDLLITTDQNLHQQQNLGGRRLAILVLPTTSWPEIEQPEAEVIAAVNTIQAGEYRELRW